MPSDNDLPPHLASPEAFARWCRENPEGVRQLEVTARRMELGEFGDVTPEMQAKVRRFLEVRQKLRPVEARSAELLAKVAKVRATLVSNQGTIPSGHLVAQLEAIEQRIQQGQPVAEDWAQFRLQLEAFQGELMGSLEKRAAMIAMSLDAQERRDPQKFADNEPAQELLRQWRAPGQREKILGKLPISERRELEALERKWREGQA